MKRSLRFGIAAIIFGLSMMSLPALAGDGNRYERRGGHHGWGRESYGPPGHAYGWHMKVRSYRPTYVFAPYHYVVPQYVVPQYYAAPQYFDSSPQVSLSFSLSGPLR